MPNTFLPLLLVTFLFLTLVTSISAGWVFDGEPPSINPMILAPCYTPDEWADTQPVKISATDNNSGVRSITFKITNISSSASKEFKAENNPVPSSNWEKNITTADIAGLGGANFDYRLEVKGIDNAGNKSLYSSNISYDFSYKTACPTNQWIQTKVGDVHTNTDINATGGP